MTASDYSLTLTFDRYVETQVAADHFIPKWTRNVEERYTLEEVKSFLKTDLLSSGSVTIEEVIDAAYNESWADDIMNSAKPEPEYCANGDFWYDQADVDFFEKWIKNILDI